MKTAIRFCLMMTAAFPFSGCTDSSSSTSNIMRTDATMTNVSSKSESMTSGNMMNDNATSMKNGMTPAMNSADSKMMDSKMSDTMKSDPKMSMQGQK